MEQISTTSSLTGPLWSSRNRTINSSWVPPNARFQQNGEAFLGGFSQLSSGGLVNMNDKKKEEFLWDAWNHWEHGILCIIWYSLILYDIICYTFNKENQFHINIPQTANRKIRDWYFKLLGPPIESFVPSCYFLSGKVCVCGYKNISSISFQFHFMQYNQYYFIKLEIQWKRGAFSTQHYLSWLMSQDETSTCWSCIFASCTTVETTVANSAIWNRVIQAFWVVWCGLQYFENINIIEAFGTNHGR